MRSSIVSSSRRAASQMCASCQREAMNSQRSRAAFFSLSATPRERTQATPISGRIPRLSPLKKQQQRRSSSSSPSSSSSSPSEQTPHSKEENKKREIPPFYALFPQTLPLGPPPSGPFHIPLRTLRNEFLKLQALSHPDFAHSSASAAAKSAATTNSAIINTAYKTLSNPLLRAQYLLHELYGVDLAGDEAGAQIEPDPELLMTVLESREIIEEADTEQDLEELREENERRIEEAEKGLEEAFKGEDVERAKEEAVRLRYWMNIREGVNNWERGRGVVLQH
ncbi:HSCB C-terminal oligomerization domain-containing protein [Cercophora samala]|uniref:HSCB C-terminal oligomerization domain-containing protein n=1 Tax=Cercophora samala TaxID=330535 RepID=A0AA39YZZ6_9PEZI|nr:HSCB C-terminal oligomerization domain-containing protein [Cercophora samala]